MTLSPDSTRKATNDCQWSLPTLKFRIEDLSHKAVDIFNRGIIPNTILRDALLATYICLFTPKTVPKNILTITMVLKPLPEAAPILSINNDEIEIYVPLSLVEKAEFCVQVVTRQLILTAAAWFVSSRFSDDSCPEALSQGLAKYALLKADLYPPGKRTGDAWDDGKTTPYFLDWIENKYGDGTIQRLVAAFEGLYDEQVFGRITGSPISALWEMYCTPVGEGGKEDDGKEEERAEPLKSWPVPKFEIQVEDLQHEGADIFYDAFKPKDPKDALTKAVQATFDNLFTLKTVPDNVKKIRLVLESKKVVPYISGSQSHREIHISLDHIKACKARASAEIMGVLVQCVCLCYLHYGYGTCPRGLSAGMAEFIRLEKHLAPPDWEQSPKGNWDANDVQTASGYFLAWIQNRTTGGEGFVRKLNQRLQRHEYDASWFVEFTGKTVDELWRAYVKDMSQPTLTLPYDIGLCGCFTKK